MRVRYLHLITAVTALWLLGWFPFPDDVRAADQNPGLELRNERFALRLGQAEHGAITSFRLGGTEEFAAMQKNPQLFALTFSLKGALPVKNFTLGNADARNFKTELHAEGQGQLATLTYEGFGNQAVRVICTARVSAQDPFVRWRLSVQVPEGLVLESVRFPMVVLRATLGSTLDDDAAVMGSTKGGVIRQPGRMPAGASVAIGQPGNMGAQFGCYYNARGGFYTAALDGRGHPKNLVLTRTREGVGFSWQQAEYSQGSVVQDYDVVMTTFTGAGGAPADWRDAADLYKQWALTQPWCATPYAQRQDVPAWMKNGPAMVRFGREWLAEPARIERWLAEYWQPNFPQAPLIMAYWGWEKHGSWVTPDYFPVFPSDQQFTQLVAKAHSYNAHAFPWPSGYHWTLTYNKRADGSFEWDDRQHFDEVARAHAVQTREGKLYQQTPSWLRGGDNSCLCGGDPWTIRWWNEDICTPLAMRGCELIQVDQVVGGRFPACYNPAHPHPAGPGVWQTEAFTKQLQTMFTTLRRIQPDAVVCFEEPNEQFNHLVGIQDYRDCESQFEWASVFNYLYHEYLPTFQSNPHNNDLVMAAYCLANGEMPHLTPTGSDLSETVLVNGGFEKRVGNLDVPEGWEHVREYQGQNWNGQAVIDELEKHSGISSLRLENAKADDVVQVSQNLPVSAGDLAAGKRYRLSAWLKTGQLARPNAISFGLFADGLKSLGGGHLAFPPAGAGWTRVAADFTVPAGSAMMRIMIHVAGPARVWVDDMALEELLPQGRTQMVQSRTRSPEAVFMRRWVSLYHGEGQPWLQFGRMLHPPKLTCGSTSYQARTQDANGKVVHTQRSMTAVFHNAFRAPDGTEAVVLANATTEPQHVTLEWKGKVRALDLRATDARLIRE